MVTYCSAPRYIPIYLRYRNSLSADYFLVRLRTLIERKEPPLNCGSREQKLLCFRCGKMVIGRSILVFNIYAERKSKISRYLCSRTCLRNRANCTQSSTKVTGVIKFINFRINSTASVCSSIRLQLITTIYLFRCKQTFKRPIPSMKRAQLI